MQKIIILPKIIVMLFNFLSRLVYFLKDFQLYLVIVIVSSFFSIVILYKIFKSEFSLQAKKIAYLIIFTLFAFVASYSIFEFYFRYIYDQSDGLGFLKVNSRWHQRHVVTNNYFFRDRDFNPVKAEGITRIGVLGDSITFGGGIENPQDRFPDLLEKRLQDAGFKAEVYNLGVPGSDTEGEISGYQSVKHLNLDIIIWQYFLNDIQPLEKSTGSAIIDKNSKISPIASFSSDKSFFFDFIYWRFSNKYQRTFEELKNADLAQYQNEQILTKHKEQIGAFIDQLQEENIKVLVIIFPFVHLIGPNYPAENIHDLMTNYFKEKGVETIDLLNDLKNKDPQVLIASRFDPHPNESVHALAAEKLFAKIAPFIR